MKRRAFLAGGATAVAAASALAGCADEPAADSPRAIGRSNPARWTAQ